MVKKLQSTNIEFLALAYFKDATSFTIGFIKKKKRFFFVKINEEPWSSIFCVVATLLLTLNPPSF